MRKLTETDVRLIAKGYWGNHFNWRIHPKSRAAVVLAGTAAVVMFTLIIVSLATTTTVPTDGVTVVPTDHPLIAAVITTLLVFVATLFWGFFVYAKERDDFVDLAIQRWEEDETLPDRGTVVDFVNKGG